MTEFKNITRLFITCLVGFSSLTLTSNDVSAADKEALLYVQVRSSKLRSKPEFWSTPLADLNYGSSVALLGAAPNNKSWLKVKLDGKEGYVHVSSVTKRKIILNAKTFNADKGVDQSSIVMAGKGFNSQVENKYGASKGLDFNAVNEVEKLSVDPTDEAKFISDGKLVG